MAETPPEKGGNIMKNANKNRRGKVAAIFLALLVTATAVPAMSISALAAETNNNTTVQPQDGGLTLITPQQVVEQLLRRVCRIQLQG